MVENNALDFMDDGDEIHVIDLNGIITDDCNDESTNGILSLASRTYAEDFNNPYNLYMNEGLDDCLENNQILQGYVKGNESSFLHYDLSEDNYYDLNPNIVNWSGLFGDSPQDTLHFKYYDFSENKIYNINEVIPFTPDMIEGNAFTPFEFTYDINSYVNGPIDCEFDIPDYQYNGSITSRLANIEVGDQIASFVGNQCRGNAEAMEFPFGSVFYLMNYGNAALTLIDAFEETFSVSRYRLNSSQSNRNIEYFNVYRNGELLNDLINDFYFIDETIDLDGEYCYEINLTDEVGNELITSMEQCIEINSEAPYILGDVNDDGAINILDIVIIVSLILNGGEYTNIADMNQDGQINILDIVVLVAQILGQ